MWGVEVALGAAGTARPVPAAACRAGVVVGRVSREGVISVSMSPGPELPEGVELDRLLSATEVATALGIARMTWNAYVARGQAPAPDEPDAETPPNRRRPRWRQSTIAEYAAGRKRSNPRRS